MQLTVKTLFSRTALLFSTFALLHNASAEPRKAAIFIENRGSATLNDKISTFEDFLTSRISGKGFSIISREVSINALKTYKSSEVAISAQGAAKEVVSTTRGTSGAVAKVSEAGAAQVSSTPSTTAADQLLSDNTSALRLAQNLNADYLIVASIASYGTEKKVFSDANLDTVNLVHTLRVTYKVLEGVHGGSLAGDVLKVSRTERFTENTAGSSNGDAINDLLDEASEKIAESFGKASATIAAAPARPGMVDFSVTCGMQDIAQLPVTVPDVRLSKDGTVSVGTERLPVDVLNATVELNGVVVGSTPGTFKGTPGLNKIRISREGFTPWERTINIVANQSLKVALQMSEAGYKRWQDNMSFLQNLENGKKLTDAQVKVLEGYAKALSESGYKVNIKVDTKEGIKGGDTIFVR